MKKRLPIALLLCISPIVALAGGDDVPSDRDIVQVQVYSTSALIQIYPKFADSQGCLNSGSGWLKVDLTKDKSLFTAILTAATAKQKVGFGIAGCAESLDYPLIKRIDIAY